MKRMLIEAVTWFTKGQHSPTSSILHASHKVCVYVQLGSLIVPAFNVIFLILWFWSVWSVLGFMRDVELSNYLLLSWHDWEGNMVAVLVRLQGATIIIYTDKNELTAHSHMLSVPLLFLFSKAQCRSVQSCMRLSKGCAKEKWNVLLLFCFSCPFVTLLY